MIDATAHHAISPASYFVCSFATSPAPIYCAWQEFLTINKVAAAAPNSNFLKGVKWSPDGSCCLTVSDDNWLRVFDLPQDALQHQPAAPQQFDAADTGAGAAAGAVGSAWQSGLQVHAGETVYDYAWFTGMSVADPVSCCFASTSRGQPIKVWDACNGQLRASYRAYDDADEITAATSLAFSPDGAKIVAGYNKTLRVFNVSRPGRDCRKIATHKKRQEGSIAGIISCLAFSPVHHDLLAVGSYSRSIGIFDARTYEQQLLMEGHKGGLTQVLFSPDGNFLYTGARQDDQLYCWDVRATGQAVYSMTRCTGSTNQRIGFSIEPCGRHLATGGCDGAVRVFDLCDGSQVAAFTAAADTVNGVDFSPCLNILATASGHRRFSLLPADGWEDERQQNDHVDLDVESSSSKRQHTEQQSAALRASDLEQQQEQQQVLQQLKRGDYRGYSADVAGLSMSSYRPGGLCNSLRLWRCECEWIAVIDAAAEPAVEEAAAIAAVDEAATAAGQETRAVEAVAALGAVGGSTTIVADAGVSR